MPDTPIPNLRHAEWVDRLVLEPLRPRNRLRTAKWVLTVLLTALAGALFKEVVHLSAMRLGWEPPPPRSGDVMPGLDGK